MTYRPSTTLTRKEARELLSDDAAIRAILRKEQRRRGKAQVGKSVRVAR